MALLRIQNIVFSFFDSAGVFRDLDHSAQLRFESVAVDINL